MSAALTIGTRVRIVAPDPGAHGAIGRIIDITPDWEHSLTVEYEDRHAMTDYFRPGELEPL